MATDIGNDGATDDDFLNHYAGTIEPELEHLEARRRRDVRLMIGCAVVALIGVAIVIWASFGPGGAGDKVIMGCVLLIMAVAALAAWTFTRLRHALKAALVAPVCHYLGYTYNRKATSFPVDRFYDLRLLRKLADSRTTTEDLVSGKRNGLDFRMCEVEIQVSSNNSGDTPDKNTPAYRGILLACTFPRPFTGETRVLESVDMNLLPKNALDGSPIEPVHLEQSRFSQSFHVYASDQVEARYLLNPAFMERLAALAEHFNPVSQAIADGPEMKVPGLIKNLVAITNPVSVAFVDRHLFVAIRSKKNRFEGGSLFKPLTDRTRVEALLQELKVVPEILDTLDIGEPTRR